jgi:hypothetical protein
VDLFLHRAVSTVERTDICVMRLGPSARSKRYIRRRCGRMRRRPSRTTCVPPPRLTARLVVWTSG